MRYGRTQTTGRDGPAGFLRGRRARWAVPAGAVVAVAAVVAGTTVAGAQTAPSLPGRSAAQLIASALRSHGPGPMTGTIQLTANLGLPDLPGSGDSSSAMSLLSGTHTANIWYADPAHVRISQPVQLGESDLRRDGQQVWLWNSRNQTATHIVLPAGRHSGPRVPATPRPPGTMPTPQQVARQVLAAVGPTTTVSVQRNVEVAGQAAYQISLAPKDSRSLVGQIRIAIDAAKSFPIRLQVFARGAASPAFQLGFTALSFGRPAASNFSFTPPAGAKVKTIRLPVLAGRPGILPGMPAPGTKLIPRQAIGKRLVLRGKNGQVVVLNPATGHRMTVRLGNGKHVVIVPARNLPGRIVTGKAGQGQRVVIVRPGKVVSKNGGAVRAVIVRPGKVILAVPAAPKGAQRNSDWQLKPVQRAPSGSLFTKPGIGAWSGFPPGMGGPLGFPFLGRPQVMGKGWLSVLVLRSGSPQQVTKITPPPAGQSGGPVTSSQTIISSHSTIASTSGPTGPAGPGMQAIAAPGVLRALLQSATPVHGAWGSGRLLRTSLVSVLITNKGTVLAGAVAPSVLYADAAQVK